MTLDTIPALSAIPFGPRVRKSPFFEATIREGAQDFTVYNHMYMPTSYGDTVAEYRAIVEGVTLWDVACERQVEIRGPDAEAFTQFLTPRDVASCPVGRCRYVIFTDDDGGIINDAVLLRLANDHFWLSPGDGDVLLWAQGIASVKNMDVEVLEPDVSPLQLQGALAPRVARKLFGDVAVEMGYFHLRELELQGIPLVISRTGWSGELGYEFYLRDGTRGLELWDLCMAAGEEFGIKPATPSTIRSVEGAILSYASDITRADNPWTVGLERLVDLGKPGDFIGRSALEKISREGTPRRLVGVEIEGAPLPANDSFRDVLVNQLVCGHITRCVWPPRLERNIGLANVPVEFSGEGTGLEVRTPDGDRRAVIVSIPWFRSETKIPVNY